MKIVFIGGRDIHAIGGIESYMYNLTVELVKLGHHPIVFCESDHNSTVIENGVKIIYQKGPKSNLICKPLLGLLATFRTIFGERDVSLIHYNAWPPSLWSWLPRLLGIPSLMQGHGLEWQRSKYSPKQQRLMLFMEKITAHLNQHLIMCSKAQTDYFRKRYGKEAFTIPTAVNLPKESENVASDILTRFNLTQRGYYLFIGRLVKDKNPDCLIRAYKESQSNNKKLVIAGDNKSQPKYMEELHDLAVGNDNIIFTGAVYGNDKEILLSNAYCFCIPSTIEGLSIALLEAMAHRLPIIASEIEGNQEVLDKDDAVWCRAGDVQSLREAIEFMDACPSGLSDMVRRNYEKVKTHYTWDKVAERYLDYLYSIGCR